MENNSNEYCKSPFIFTEENDECTLNRENILKKYLLNFNNFFKSFVSNYFLGLLNLLEDALNVTELEHFLKIFFI